MKYVHHWSLPSWILDSEELLSRLCRGKSNGRSLFPISHVVVEHNVKDQLNSWGNHCYCEFKVVFQCCEFECTFVRIQISGSEQLKCGFCLVWNFLLPDWMALLICSSLIGSCYTCVEFNKVFKSCWTTDTESDGESDKMQDYSTYTQYHIHCMCCCAYKHHDENVFWSPGSGYQINSIPDHSGFGQKVRG